MRKTAGTLTIAAALLLSCIELAPCAAQTPALPPPSPPVITPERPREGRTLPSPLASPTAAERNPADAGSTPPSPLAASPKLEAPMEPGDLRFPINLAT